MMQKLADDPAFWGALSAILGLIVVWAKAKTAEIEGRDNKKALDLLTAGHNDQQAQLRQQQAQIAALQATTGSTPAPAPLAPPLAPLPVPPAQPSAGTPAQTTPTVLPMPLQSAPAPAPEQDSAGPSAP